jgi:DNA-binding transcriptional regulator YiaG
MTTLAKIFKDEIRRLARQEAKTLITPIRKPAGATRLTMASMKRRLDALEKESRRQAKLLAASHQQPPTTNQQPSAAGARLTGRGMRKLRRRLGLSADALGKLVNVTKYSVYDWEKHNGPLHLRQTTRAAILAIRHLWTRPSESVPIGHRKVYHPEA